MDTRGSDPDLSGGARAGKSAKIYHEGGPGLLEQASQISH